MSPIEAGLALSEAHIQFIAAMVKFVVFFAIAMQVPPIMIWAERRVCAVMQRRKGPNRVGIGPYRLFGLVQPVADMLKLLFKEEIVPRAAHKFFFHLAPVFSLFPAIVLLTVVPFGPDFELWGHRFTMSVTTIDTGFLTLLAIAGISVYGVALAGWAANNKYSLLGGMRSAAQMISYEIPLGLSLVPIVLIYQTFDLNEIVQQQAVVWGVFKAPISFLLFLICMFAETNRTPFDLAEGESEIVAGFFTEYGTMKFGGIFLGEYLTMFVLSCVCSILFFGGWQLPFISYNTVLQCVGGSSLGASLVGMVVLLLKAGFFLFVYTWVRWSVPRFRYDQLMQFGWRFLLPVGLANVVLTAILIPVFKNL